MSVKIQHGNQSTSRLTGLSGHASPYKSRCRRRSSRMGLTMGRMRCLARRDHGRSLPARLEHCLFISYQASTVRHSRQKEGWHECKHTRTLQNISCEVDGYVEEFLIAACPPYQLSLLDMSLTDSHSGAPTKMRLLPLAIIFIMVEKAAIGSHSTMLSVSIFLKSRSY